MCLSLSRLNALAFLVGVVMSLPHSSKLSPVSLLPSAGVVQIILPETIVMMLHNPSHS